MSKQNSLTEGKLVPTLLSFTVPFLFSSLLQTLYGTVDTLVVGNFSTTASLSAVSTGAQVLSLVTFLALGLCSGATVLLGQCIGAKDHKQAAKIVGNTIIDFAVVSLILVFVLLSIHQLAFRLLNVPAEALEEARRYCIICSFGIPLIIGYNTVCAVLRAMGDSTSPLIFVFVACIINIIGDLLLTGYLGMGAAGVAIATVAAQGCSFLFSLFFIMKKGLGFSFTKADIRFDSRTSGRIFSIGLPMGVQSILINISFLFITSIINAMGLTASAALGVGEKITNFAFLPQNAFFGSLAVIVAQNIGARQPDRAIKAVRIGASICFCIGCCFCLFCQTNPTLLPSFFSKDQDVIRLAGQYMRAYSIDAVCTSVSFCMSAFMNGCGKTKYNMCQNLISTFLGRVPATYFLSKLPNTSLFLIGLAAPASTIITLILLGVYLIGGFWKRGLYDNMSDKEEKVAAD